MHDEQRNPWWTTYFQEAHMRGLTKETNIRALDQPITRYELALLLWRVVHPISQETT